MWRKNKYLSLCQQKNLLLCQCNFLLKLNNLNFFTSIEFKNNWHLNTFKYTNSNQYTLKLDSFCSSNARVSMQLRIVLYRIFWTVVNSASLWAKTVTVFGVTNVRKHENYTRRCKMVWIYNYILSSPLRMNNGCHEYIQHMFLRYSFLLFDRTILEKDF